MKTITLEIPDILDWESEEKLKAELTFYLSELLEEKESYQALKARRIPKFGCAKGKFRMAADFDAPIDHFDEYMPS